MDLKEGISIPAGWKIYSTKREKAGLNAWKDAKMAICVKRTDKLLFTEGITAHFIASLELFEGGDVDFLLAGVITFCRLILA